PQLVVIIAIVVDQRQRINALRQHLVQPVLDSRRIPSIMKTIPQPLQQSDPAVGLSQQQSTGIGTDRSTVETRHHLARKKLFKLETVLITLCHSEGRPFLGANLFSINMFMPEVTAFCYIFGEKCGLDSQIDELSCIKH